MTPSLVRRSWSARSLRAGVLGLWVLVFSTCVGGADPTEVATEEAPFVTGARCNRSQDCPAIANAVATCSNRRCNYACNANFKLCGSACIPNAGCCTSADCGGGAAACNGTCQTTNHVCTFPTGVSCGTPTCSGTNFIATGVCSQGNCVFPSPIACAGNFVCSGTACRTRCTASADCAAGVICSAGSCVARCTSDASCPSGSFCVISAGVCTPRSPLGVGCTASNQCASGNCVDGVCCNTACNDGCHSCALPGTVGTCTTRLTEFTPPLGAAFESVPIVVGPDANLWFLEEGVPGGPSRMGRITTSGVLSEFAISTVERGFMSVGADGTIWFNDSRDDPNFAIFRVAVNGTQLLTFFPPPAGAFGTGRMFFDGTGTWVAQVDESGNNQHEIVLLNSLQQVSRAVTVGFVAGEMTHGPDGNLWVVGPNEIARVAANNALTIFPVSGVNQAFSGLTTGPDGNIWFTEPANNKIGRMTISGVAITEFTLPTAGSSPGRLASGPAGALWFIEPSSSNSRLGRITPTGVITECPIPDSRQSAPGEIVVGPDQNIWFTGLATTGNAVRIYRYRP